ncbi:glycosyltransferase involved in cell wall biosynthesis [Mycolicibacterium sp. BK556]|uniref:glycosyltransferase n=1 Tax=unclassified Mycolicibacterium TaxID=2636767 RepID=UPI001804F8C5|nr:glycosyltransferase involved in cell wall biosynthesis [Mycolicibacterium sp. BK556]MBB3635385.1 glycosyltransferase involved in cell wall biosynthesis [Mycolicibacterium sp. BK607]
MNAPDRAAPAPLTVAHVIHSLGSGGAEAVLVDLARAAPSAAIRLVVIGLSDAHAEGAVDNRAVPLLREQGATVYEMHSGRYDLTAVIRLAKVLRDERVDIVHTHLKHADLVGGLAARLVGVPSVSTLHVIDIPRSRASRLRVKAAVVGRRFLSRAVIALSSAQRRWYAEYAGAAAPIVVLPNGVVEPRVTRDRAAIRDEIGVPEGHLLAVCASLMRPEKGHADLVEAVRLLPADVPVVVALAGDGPLLDEIQSSVDSDPSLARRVRILGFRGDVPDLIAAADFVVQPSLEDALPTSLISSLAGARPIVATNVGGIPDIVGPGCGLLVAAGQPAALSSGIADMATTIQNDPGQLAAMERATRERYDTTYSADVWVQNLRALYSQVLRRDTARAPQSVVLVEFPPSGGLYQFSLQLGEALARAGDSVELVTGPSPELGSRELGCRVLSILPTWHPTAGAALPELLRKGRRVIRAGRHTAAWGVLLAHLIRTRPDVVVWSAWRFPSDGWGVRAVRKVIPNALLVLVAHEPRALVEQPGQDGLYKTSPLMTRALGPAYADLDAVFVLGESAKRILLETWPVTAPVHVIPHGDEGIYASATMPSPAATGPQALCFGTVTAYKGIDTLFKAWPAVRAQLPDAELMVAGALGPDMDESALRAEVAQLSGVRLELGYIPVSDVASYFAPARCVVLPYKRSSQSGVAHLAYTLGRPVVATRVGDIPVVVRDGISGILVDPDDPDSLAAGLIRLLTDPALAETMGKAGEQSLAGVSWDEVGTQVLAALSDARKARGATGLAQR